MPVDQKHPNYEANIAVWQRCRDVYEGDDQVKSRGYTYLPRIDRNQNREEYSSYSSRVTLYESVGKTVDSFAGAISRRPHKIDLPASLASMFDDATCTGISLDEFIKNLCRETLLTGRGGILVEYDDAQQRAKLCFYPAEAITNWSADRIILSEAVFEQDGSDPYKMVAVEQLRELQLVDGAYTSTVWRKRPNNGLMVGNEWIAGEPVTATRRGKPMDRIPFVWLSILGATPDISKPPLLGLVNLALHHYRMSADYAHGLHFTGLPTLYVTGAPDDKPVSVGAATAILLKGANAKVGYAEFTGQGLGSLERAIAASEQRMASLGAAILSSDARRMETAEAARIRSAGETSLLQAAVAAVQASLRVALTFAVYWTGAYGEASVELNDDFISNRLDSSTLLGLVQAFQSGALTLSAFLQALVDGDLLPQETVVADEVAKLATAGPKLVAMVH